MGEQPREGRQPQRRGARAQEQGAKEGRGRGAGATEQGAEKRGEEQRIAALMSSSVAFGILVYYLM